MSNCSHNDKNILDCFSIVFVYLPDGEKRNAQSPHVRVFTCLHSEKPDLRIVLNMFKISIVRKYFKNFEIPVHSYAYALH